MEANAMNKADVNAINKGAIDFNIQAKTVVKSIVEPLFSYTGLTHFAYNKFIPGQKYMTLVTDIANAQMYLDKELDRYLLFEYLLIPKNSKRVIFWDAQPENGLLDSLRFFNYSHGLSIYIRGEDEIEAWHFATSIENSQMNQFYLNHPDVIDQFIVYFKEKAKDLVSTDDSKMAIYSGDRSFNMSDNQTNQFNDLKELLQVKKYSFTVGGKDISLSRREFEALNALSKGLSIKSIARQLELSPRTVEDYLNNAKTKLGTSSSDGLIKVMNESIYSKLKI